MEQNTCCAFLVSDSTLTCLVLDSDLMFESVVSIPELIAQTNMDQQSVGRLREELIKLTMWLASTENIRKYFSTPYTSR
jgi:hypothetical protein